jgi:hypothetical protein
MYKEEKVCSFNRHNNNFLNFLTFLLSIVRLFAFDSQINKLKPITNFIDGFSTTMARAVFDQLTGSFPSEDHSVENAIACRVQIGDIGKICDSIIKP